jgi:hypothetical protein
VTILRAAVSVISIMGTTRISGLQDFRIAGSNCRK